MGMYYFIRPNIEVNCENSFGDSLSYFFEQIGGYEETAEVVQVSKLLDIDLELFQHISYSTETENGELKIVENWIDIDTITTLVETFMRKIHVEPNFYKKIIHHENYYKEKEEIERIFEGANTNIDKKMEANPTHFYPPNLQYFEKGIFSQELTSLLETLKCYKKNRVEKVKLEYM